MPISSSECSFALFLEQFTVYKLKYEVALHMEREQKETLVKNKVTLSSDIFINYHPQIVDFTINEAFVQFN